MAAQARPVRKPSSAPKSANAGRSQRTRRGRKSARPSAARSPLETGTGPDATAPDEAPASSRKPKGTPASLSSRKGDDPALELEDSVFFESCSWSEAPGVLTTDEPHLARLTQEQWQRRLWFRRQVRRMMACLGAFALVVTAIRVLALD